MNVCAEEEWVFSPDASCSEKNKIDPAHWVQMQLQMHSTGSDVAFLGQWTLNNGTALYRMAYSSDFMRAASKVLKFVFDLYLCKGNTLSDNVHLPHFAMTQEDTEFRSAWESMMGSLQDIISSVELIAHPGVTTNSVDVGGVGSACRL
jgi:hypothetical protein